MAVYIPCKLKLADSCCTGLHSLIIVILPPRLGQMGVPLLI